MAAEHGKEMVRNSPFFLSAHAEQQKHWAGHRPKERERKATARTMNTLTRERTSAERGAFLSVPGRKTSDLQQTHFFQYFIHFGCMAES